MSYAKSGCMGLVKKAIYLTAAKKAFDWMRNRKHNEHESPTHAMDRQPRAPGNLNRPQDPRGGQERDLV